VLRLINGCFYAVWERRLIKEEGKKLSHCLQPNPWKMAPCQQTQMWVCYGESTPISSHICSAYRNVSTNTRCHTTEYNKTNTTNIHCIKLNSHLTFNISLHLMCTQQPWLVKEAFSPWCCTEHVHCLVNYTESLHKFLRESSWRVSLLCFDLWSTEEGMKRKEDSHLISTLWPTDTLVYAVWVGMNRKSVPMTVCAWQDSVGGGSSSSLTQSC